MIKLLRELHFLGKLNNDVFKIAITPRLERRGTAVSYEVTVIETAERHALIGVRASTVEEAVQKIRDGLDQACKDWGYKNGKEIVSKEDNKD